MPGNFSALSFSGNPGGFSVDSALGGKGDGEERARRGIFKPTGLLDLPTIKARPSVRERAEQSQDVQNEVRAQVYREITKGTPEAPPTPPAATMSLREIDAEIGELMRAAMDRRLRQDEEEVLLLLMAASAAG